MNRFENIERLIDFWEFNEADKAINIEKKKESSHKDSLALEILENYLLITKRPDIKLLESTKNLVDRAIKEGNLSHQIDTLTNLFFLVNRRRDLIDQKFDSQIYFLLFTDITKDLKEDHLDKKIIRKLARLYTILGRFSHLIDINYDKAINYLNKAVMLSEETDILINTQAHGNLGIALLTKGDLISASEHFNIIKGRFEKLPPIDKLKYINRMGIFTSYKGNFPEAISYFEEGLDYAKKFDTEDFDNKEWIFSFESNLWEFKAELGETEKALKVFDKSLSFYRKSKPKTSKIWILFNLIKFGINVLPKSLIEEYLQEIKEAYESSGKRNKISYQYFRLAKGIILNHSERLQNKVKAQELFREVANEPIVWFDITFESQRWLGKVLLQELQYTSSSEVLEELTDLIMKMIDSAEKKNSKWLLVESYLLQAKLELIKFKFKEFDQILNKTEKISEEHGLTGYNLRIKKERLLFEEQFNTWKNLLDENASYLKRIEQANLTDYINDAKKITNI